MAMSYTETVTIEEVLLQPQGPATGAVTSSSATIVVTLQRPNGQTIVITDTMANLSNYTVGATHTLSIA